MKLTRKRVSVLPLNINSNAKNIMALVNHCNTYITELLLVYRKESKAT